MAPLDGTNPYIGGPASSESVVTDGNGLAIVFRHMIARAYTELLKGFHFGINLALRLPWHTEGMIWITSDV